MATISAAGIAARDLSSYRTLLETEFRRHFGVELDVAPETPQGGLIAIMAASLAEEDEALVADAQATGVDTAAGVQLDDIGTLLGVERRAATRSTVTMTLTGESGTAIATGARVRNADGIRFRSTEDATIGATGSVEVEFEAVDAGAVEAAANSLSTIETLVAGWETATNAAAAATGSPEETDAAYRAQLRSRSARGTVHTDDALLAGLFEAGAIRVRLERNDTASAVTRQGASIAANSIMAIVEGGTDADIAAAIAARKAPGVGLAGTTTENGVQFERVEVTQFSLALTIATQHSFPSDGVIRIRSALVDFVGGDWSGGRGLFETDGLGIGEGPDTNRLLVPAQSVPGHLVQTIAATLTGGGDLPVTTPLARRYSLDPSDITIDVA